MKTRPHLSSPAVVTRQRRWWRHTSPPQEAARGACVSRRRPARPAPRQLLAVLATVTALALATTMATDFVRRWTEARDSADCDGLKDMHDTVRRLGLDGLDEFLDTCVSPSVRLRAALLPLSVPLLRASEAVCAQLHRVVQLLTRLGAAVARLAGVAVRRRSYEFVAAMTPAADEGLTVHTVMNAADMGDTTDTDKDAPEDLQQKSREAVQAADHRTDEREDHRQDLRQESCEDPSRDQEFYEDLYEEDLHYEENLYEEDLHYEENLYEEDLHYENLYEEDVYDEHLSEEDLNGEHLYEADHLNKHLPDEGHNKGEGLYNEHLYEGVARKDRCGEDLDGGLQDGGKDTAGLVRPHTQEDNTMDAHSQESNTDDGAQHSQGNTQHAHNGEDIATHAHDELDQPEEYTRNGDLQDSIKDFL